MKKMTMEKAIEYCKDKRVAIHTPTQEVYDNLGSYVNKSEYRWLPRNYFPENGKYTCVNLENGYTCYAYYDYYKGIRYEIIELITDDSLTITIKSDGHKVVSASCNNITTTAKCNDTDTFNLSKGSHIALKRLIDKMNEPVKEDKSNKIEKGDIVELLPTNRTAPKEFIGLQGIVMENDSVPFVKFPIKLRNGLSTWACMKKYLKLIRKASK